MSWSEVDDVVAQCYDSFVVFESLRCCGIGEKNLCVLECVAR